MSDTRAESQPLGSARLALLLVLALALVLRLGTSTPAVIGSDLSTAYYQPALDLIQFGTGPWDQWNTWYVRLGVIVPLALAHALAGGAEMAIPLAGLPFGMLQVLLVFLIGRLLFEDSVAILAAFLEAVYPVSVLYGAQPLPDTPMACWTTASVFFFLYAHRRSRRHFFFVAGLCLGLAYTAKITGLFGGVVLLGLAFLERREFNPRDLLLVAAGALGVLALETVVLTILHGEWTMRVLNMLNASSGFAETGSIVISWSRYIPGFFSGLLWPLDHGFVYHGLMGWAAVAASVYLMARSSADGAVRIILLWWLALILLLNFACIGFAQPIVPKIQMRYLMFTTPPGVLILSVCLIGAGKKLRELAVIIFAVTCLFCSCAIYSTLRPHDAGYRHLYEVVRTEGPSSGSIYFQQRIFAHYVSLSVGEGAAYEVARSGEDLVTAQKGDLAVLVIDSYHRLEDLPRGYLEQLQRPDWLLIDEWRSEPDLMAGFMKAMHIEVDKGFEKHVTVFRKTEAGRMSPKVIERAESS